MRKCKKAQKKSRSIFERLNYMFVMKYYFKLAWAAATRAIGTRYGEQLT